MDKLRDLENEYDGPINEAAAWNARHGEGALQRMQRASAARFYRCQAAREQDPAKRAEMLAHAMLCEEMAK